MPAASLRFLDAAAARSRGRAVLVAAILVLLPPALFHLLAAAAREPSGRARFDNEAAATERKEAAWGLTEVALGSTILGVAFWTAHRNRGLMRVEIGDAGLHYHSMFRAVRPRWDEVQAVEALESRSLLHALAGRILSPPALRIRTARGDIRLPATMTDASVPPPEVLGGAGGMRLRHADGRIEAVSGRSNPLLREIEARMAGK